MRRNRVVKALASVFSVWLAICMVEPRQLHSCEMHGGLAIEQTESTHGDAAGGHRMAVHHAVDQSGHNHGTDGQSHQCSCLGDCNGGSAPVGPTGAAVALFDQNVIGSSISEFAHASPKLTAASFLLPFANGPPASSSRA